MCLPKLFHISIPVAQVLEAIPDEEFSLSLSQPCQLMSKVVDALCLPLRLQGKWLRADCLSTLDLRGRDIVNILTIERWRSLVSCFAAVPGLKALHVQLPRGVHTPPKAPTPKEFPTNLRLNYTAKDVTLLKGYLCTYCHASAYKCLCLAKDADALSTGTGAARQECRLTGNVHIPEGVYVALGFSIEGTDKTTCRCAKCFRCASKFSFPFSIVESISAARCIAFISCT